MNSLGDRWWQTEPFQPKFEDCIKILGRKKILFSSRSQVRSEKKKEKEILRGMERERRSQREREKVGEGGRQGRGDSGNSLLTKQANMHDHASAYPAYLGLLSTCAPNDVLFACWFCFVLFLLLLLLLVYFFREVIIEFGLAHTHCADQAGLSFAVVPSPLSPKRCDHRRVPSCLPIVTFYMF